MKPFQMIDECSLDHAIRNLQRMSNDEFQQRLVTTGLLPVYRNGRWIRKRDEGATTTHTTST